jgi:hypothetical protein
MGHMSFDDALVKPEPKVAAWNVGDDGSTRTLSIFDLASGGVTQIAWREYPVNQIDAVSQTLSAQGIPIGAYDGHQPFVWLVEPSQLTVWGPDKLVLEGRGGAITTSSGLRVDAADIAAVIGYVEDDYVDRGLKIEMRDGELRTVLFDLSMAASGNPTYSRNDLLLDTRWISVVGAALAKWAGVSYRRTF